MTSEITKMFIPVISRPKVQGQRDLIQVRTCV